MQGVACFPALITTGLDTGTPSKSFVAQVLSYDIGPAAGPPVGGLPTRVLSHPADVTVTLLPNPDPGVGAYNGISGTNPRGFSFQVNMTYTGATRSAGQVTIQTGDLDVYGTALLTIDLTGSVADFGDHVLDTFQDVNGTTLHNHHPDLKVSDAVIVGWEGKASFSDVITGNKLVSGGNNGNIQHGRIFLGRSDFLLITASIKRVQDPGGAGEFFGLLGRLNAVTGNTDAAVEGVAFYATKHDANGIDLTWELDLIIGGRVQSDLLFANIAWAYGVTREMAMAFVGTKLFLLIDGALVLTRTLNTPLNDVNHECGGIIHSNFTDCVEFTRFFGGPLSLVGSQNPGGAWEATGLLTPQASPPWESFLTLEQQASPSWESQLGIVETADVPGESLAGITADADVPWENGPQWSQEGGGGDGPWAQGAVPPGPWSQESGGGGGWSPT